MLDRKTYITLFLVIVGGMVTGNFIWSKHEKKEQEQELIVFKETIEQQAKIEQAKYEEMQKQQDEEAKKLFEEFKAVTDNIK